MFNSEIEEKIADLEKLIEEEEFFITDLGPESVVYQNSQELILQWKTSIKLLKEDQKEEKSLQPGYFQNLINDLDN